MGSSPRARNPAWSGERAGAKALHEGVAGLQAGRLSALASPWGSSWPITVPPLSARSGQRSSFPPALCAVGKGQSRAKPQQSVGSGLTLASPRSWEAPRRSPGHVTRHGHRPGALSPDWPVPPGRTSRDLPLWRRAVIPDGPVSAARPSPQPQPRGPGPRRAGTSQSPRRDLEQKPLDGVTNQSQAFAGAAPGNWAAERGAGLPVGAEGLPPPRRLGWPYSG